MNTFFAVTLLVCFFVSVNSQQWTPQQLAVYRQQYYNWWYNQQHMQQVQQQPQPVAQPAQPQSPFFGGAQSDNKGNYWHGDDNAKLLLVARSSWP